MKKVTVLGTDFARITLEEAVTRTQSFVSSGKPHLIITANPETVMRAREDQLFGEIVKRADLVVADGIGVVWAGRVLGSPLPERIPGIELSEALLREAAQRNWRVYFLGGAPGIAQKAAAEAAAKYLGLQIVGTDHGYFQQGFEEAAVIKRIKKSDPQLLLAALGMPRQEKWLAAHLGTLQVPVAIGVGGSFDVWAGIEPRAPKWLRRIHLEWFFRLVKQPWRARRMAALPRFAAAVCLSKMRPGR